MKKSQIVLFTAILAVVVLFALTVKADRDNRTVSEERQLDEFSSIRLEGSIDLKITVDDERKVIVNAEERNLDKIDTRVSRRGTLIISQDNYRSRYHSYIEIHTPKLTELTINGSGDAELDYGWGENLEISIHGSGDVYAEGKVKELNIGVYGSGDVKAHNLKAENAEVSIHGSGDVDVFARENFVGNIYGSGDIDLEGDPENRTYNVHGSGDISGMMIPPIPDIPAVPAMPALPSMPSLAAVPALPAMPAMPSLPAMPELPQLNEIAPMPAIPELPALPAVPAMPPVPKMQYQKVYDKDISCPE